MKETIIEKLTNIVINKFGKEYAPLIEVSRVTKPHIDADFYSNIAMKLAKSLKQNPGNIAKNITEAIVDLDDISVSVAKPGYINFQINKNLKNNSVYEIAMTDDLLAFFKVDNPKKIHLEFVSANPTGPLHVGHGRGAIFGNVLKKFLKVQGHDVHSEYYVNNVGNQMRNLWESVRRRHSGDDVDLNENDLYVGDYIDDVHAAMSKSIKGDFENCNEKEAIDILCDIMISKFIKPDLDYLDITFDEWYKESNLVEDDSVKKIIEKLKNSKDAVEIDGALMLKADELRAMIKSNGDLTYFASDLAYHDKKLKNYELVIDIWGADHHGYEPRIREGLKKLGHDDSKLQVKLIQFANLYKNKEKISMSTRKGTFVTLKKLADEIGNDAIYFFYLTKNSNQHLDFDLDVAVSQDKNNPVYYIQYAHARIEKILNQVGSIENVKFNPELISDREDTDLIDKLNRYKDIFGKSLLNLEPHLLANYLYDLASEFHSYYSNVRIITEDINYSRIYLIYSVQKVLKNGLGLLNVSAPTKM